MGQLRRQSPAKFHVAPIPRSFVFTVFILYALRHEDIFFHLITCLFQKSYSASWKLIEAIVYLERFALGELCADLVDTSTSSELGENVNILKSHNSSCQVETNPKLTGNNGSIFLLSRRLSANGDRFRRSVCASSTSWVLDVCAENAI